MDDVCIVREDFPHWCCKHSQEICKGGGRRHCNSGITELAHPLRYYTIDKITNRPVEVETRKKIICNVCVAFNLQAETFWRNWVSTLKLAPFVSRLTAIDLLVFRVRDWVQRTTTLEQITVMSVLQQTGLLDPSEI